MTALTPDETILGLIAVQSRHGYELIEMFHDPEELGAIWKMSTSQIYAVLKRLQRQALIVGREVESDTAPSRTEFYLTAEGEHRLQTWLHEPTPSASIRRVRVEFLSRLHIAQQLNISTQPIIQRQRFACEVRREQLVTTLCNKEPGIGHLAHELVIAQLDAVLSWIEQYESTSTNPEN